MINKTSSISSIPIFLFVAEHDGTILIINSIMKAAVLFLWILCSSSCQKNAWEKAGISKDQNINLKHCSIGI